MDIFGRDNGDGTVSLFYAESGEVVTRLLPEHVPISLGRDPSAVWVIDSDRSAEWEHPDGIAISDADAVSLGIEVEFVDEEGATSDLPFPNPKTAYTLNLTENDIETIYFVGSRYGWSESLIDAGVAVGANGLEEHETWSIRDGIESDMEGGHDAYPMLDHGRSDLGDKLNDLYNSVV